MKPIKQTLLSGAMMLALSLVFTSCDDILGEWDRPAPNPVVPTPSPDPDPTPTPTLEPTMLETPLTFEAAEAGTQVIFNIVTTVATNEVQYSTDGEHWSTYTSGTAITLTNVGDKVMFRGTNATYAGPFSPTDNNSNFSCNKYCYIYGNIMSLIKAEGFETVTELTGTDNFRALFYGNKYIKNHTDASKYLVLPATKMTENCYRQMFYNCNALTTTPVLKVDCNSALGCMSKMFEECHNLTAVAAGSEITGNMGSHACEGMFQNCPELKTVPSTFLPATTLAEGCYQSMFNFCNALEKAPNLPAETLVASCYDAMFHFCKSLNEVRVKAGYTTAGNACLNMFSYCTNASTSKFYTDGTWSDWKNAFSNIDLWTKYSYTPGLAVGKFTINADGDQIQFAQGNLQATYDGSAWTWSFAEHQYDYIGNAAGNTSVTSAAPWISAPGTVDLFGWSTANTYFGINNSTDEATYSGDFVDWGTLAISNGGNMPNSGWRTLTNNEWLYLLKTRTVNGGNGEGKSYTLGQNVNGKLGIVIYPDGYASSVYAGSDWATFEAAGCVFLPAAGYRTDTTVQNVDDRGHYWSSSSNNPIYAKPFCFTSNSMITDALSDRIFGFSVRLVRDVE